VVLVPGGVRWRGALQGRWGWHLAHGKGLPATRAGAVRWVVGGKAEGRAQMQVGGGATSVLRASIFLAKSEEVVS
jgi:hypothetical protein